MKMNPEHRTVLTKIGMTGNDRRKKEAKKTNLYSARVRPPYVRRWYWIMIPLNKSKINMINHIGKRLWYSFARMKIKSHTVGEPFFDPVKISTGEVLL